MKAYLNLLQTILDNGIEKESGRANMPNTIGISKADISMDLSKGFPLLTTKKMYWKGIVHELLWFLRGETNIKYLIDNDVNIWNSDAYKWYLKKCGNNVYFDTIEKFVEFIKSSKYIIFYKSVTVGNILGDFIEKKLLTHLTDLYFTYKYTLGDLGKVYGHQWRNQNGIDQIKELFVGENSLITNPYSRYHIIDGWNKADFQDMALPPCHLLYQFIVRPLSFKERRDLAQKYAIENNKIPLLIDGCGVKDFPRYMEVIDDTGWNIPKFYLDLNMYQRSVDTPLGCPYNLASMSLLLMIFAKANNMIAGVANWIGGDTHIYLNQLDGIKEQLSRKPMKLPKMEICKELNCLDDILTLTINDFKLIDYVSHPTIKIELSVGLKK